MQCTNRSFLCRMPSMRLLTSSSKKLILAVLSCSLITFMYGSNVNLTELDSADVSTYTNSSVNAEESIWKSISRELTLDHKDQSSQVKAEIRKLLADQDKLYKILKAAGPYIYFIHQQTQMRGMPAELALIPVIESEFNPNDHSNKGATGLWQLMPGTASELGVKVKSGYDGRRNVVASTKAALTYLNDLCNNFDGNWYLAIAAYNCGQGKIESAQRRTGSDNFFKLPLPRETQLYVPKLLAVAAIVKDPKKYGVELPTINNKPYFKEMKVTKPVNLAKLAKTSGISMETMHTLNPDRKQEMVTPGRRETSTVLVPINKVPEIKARSAGAIV
jgi:membrane-bound lytic murein transglycosylase D